MMLCAQLYGECVEPRDLLILNIAAVRFTSLRVRPFDIFSLIYLHCIDLSTKKYIPTLGFPCLEICICWGTSAS